MCPFNSLTSRSNMSYLYQTIADTLSCCIISLLWLKLERRKMRTVLHMVIDIRCNLSRFFSQGVSNSRNFSRDARRSTTIISFLGCHDQFFSPTSRKYSEGQKTKDHHQIANAKIQKWIFLFLFPFLGGNYRCINRILLNSGWLFILIGKQFQK